MKKNSDESMRKFKEKDKEISSLTNLLEQEIQKTKQEEGEWAKVKDEMNEVRDSLGS